MSFSKIEGREKGMLVEVLRGYSGGREETTGLQILDSRRGGCLYPAP